ncbi:MAG: DUF4062 domain-containing protein [Gammaproteobacteria bacterium]|nr:DUF4062 domain-containing protein [Gammaproteobacteria bacterium]
MTPIRIFISSVQREFTLERERLRDYLRGDPLMRRFFEVFLFEEVPASDQRPDRVYLDEVDRCDIYVGLLGRDYGSMDSEGISPTEHEFERATELDKHRLIFVKGADGSGRHPKMEALIARAQAGLVRRRFSTPAELIAGVYASLVQYLEAKELLRFGPFDAAPCSGATLDDLDFEDMYRFIRIARRARQFPLPAETPPEDLLRHLNLLNRGRLTNAAMLLFGQVPQRFLISSEIKCAHFHGTEVAKPIPSYQVYKGTVFALVDQAVDFVMSKIALSVGTRAESVQVPVKYEIPKEVVTEAIVNAVAHRDYTDSSSVQVMLFADRLEVMNSGRLPPALTVEKLRVSHQSLPGNPLLAESMYLLQYIERMGTGTVDMIRRCAEAGLPEPEFEVGAGFLIRIWRAGATRKPPEKKGSSQNLANRILTFLREHPSASRRDITGALEGTTEWSVRYQLDKLKESGKLRRIGPDRGGRWLVVDGPDADPREEPDDSSGDHPDAREIQPVVSQKTARKAPENRQKTARSEGQSPEPQSLSDRILALLRQNPSAGRREIAATLGTTRSIVRYRLDKLRAAGRIERVGPDKGGYWRVLGESAAEPDARS